MKDISSGTLQKALTFIESWLAFRYDRLDAPGISVAILHKDTLVFQKAHGYADLETKEPLTPDHIFRVASHSKMFTATALMQLQEKGKLCIDDLAVDYIPWLKEHKDARWRSVTIRQLMSHSAGVIRDGEDADYWELWRSFPDKTAFKKALLGAELVYENNTRMKYSNFGYTLLGLVVEAASGMSYNEYIDRYIIQSLGLSHTGSDYSDEIASMLVTGYTKRQFHKKRVPFTHKINTYAMSPATGLYSTPADICRFIAAHFWRHSEILSRESKKEMQRAHWDVPNEHGRQYGLGFMGNYVDEHRFVGHVGGFPGQSSCTFFDPEQEVAVSVCVNAIDVGAGAIATGILSVIDWFMAHDNGSPSYDPETYSGRFLNVWGTMQVVAIGTTLVSINPDTWRPFDTVEKLSFIDDGILQIDEASGFLRAGERVIYHFADDKVQKVVEGGMTFLPETKWMATYEDKTVIELEENT